MITAAATTTLTVDGLTVSAFDRKGGSVKLVNGVSLGLAQGEILGLLGESGSGKTMICRAITGALPPGVHITAGRIDTGSRRPAAIFADPHASLDPLQKVGEQIAEVARVARGLGRDEARVEALRLMEAMSLQDTARIFGQFPFQVSGGMAQRIMIAAALALRPQFIIADEPTSALDATVQVEVLDVLKGLAKTAEVGILLTTHDIAVASRVCTSIAVVYAGRICEIGRVDEVLHRPRHPYTRLLLSARPHGRRGVRLATIRGEPLSPGDERPACDFAPRCPKQAAICLDTPPLLRAYAASRVACHFPEPDQDA
jgi:oligopeptide/dipeptide ABC transporter ATP-binding protein